MEKLNLFLNTTLILLRMGFRVQFQKILKDLNWSVDLQEAYYFPKEKERYKI